MDLSLRVGINEQAQRRWEAWAVCFLRAAEARGQGSFAKACPSIGLAQEILCEIDPSVFQPQPDDGIAWDLGSLQPRDEIGASQSLVDATMKSILHSAWSLHRGWDSQISHSLLRGRILRCERG